MSMEIVLDDTELINFDDEVHLLTPNNSTEPPPIIDLDEPLIRLQAMGDDSSTSQTMQLKEKFGSK